MKRPTMRDVAKAAGVSEATVSYVINNGPRPVQKDTRQKILAAINELGYRPHAIARSLKKGSTRTVGLLVQSLISPFVSNLVNAIEKNLAKYDYGLILASAHENCEREGKMINTLASQSIDGLLYIPTSCSNANLVNRLIQEGLPVVFVDREVKGVPADLVKTDHKEAARKVTQDLIHNGCQRILCISFSDEASSALERVDGYLQALQENDIPPDEDLIYIFQYSSGESVEQSLINHIELHGMPDGILTTTENILIDVADALKNKDIVVPEQIQVAGGFFNSPWNKLLNPPLPVVSQNYEQISERAVEFLLDRIDGNTEPPRIDLIEPIF